jgi:hypothetical protein
MTDIHVAEQQVVASLGYLPSRTIKVHNNPGKHPKYLNVSHSLDKALTNFLTKLSQKIIGAERKREHSIDSRNECIVIEYTMIHKQCQNYRVIINNNTGDKYFCVTFFFLIFPNI